MHLSDKSGKSRAEFVALALESGADADARSKNGASALCYAASNDDVSAVRTLIEYGADLDSADSEGQTPLMLAADSGHEECVELLLRHGAETKMRSKAIFKARANAVASKLRR